MPSNEVLGAAAFFIAALLAGLGQYFFKRPVPPVAASTAAQTVISSIGMGWLERDQMERFLSAIERIAKSQERIANAADTVVDRQKADMSDRIDELMDVLRDKERRISDLEGMRSRRRPRG